VEQPKPKEESAPAKSEETREEEKVRLGVLVTQIDTIIDEANIQHKKSLYEEAIAIYQKAADLISSKKPNFNHFKKSLTEKEALIFSSIAACYK
jgi:hypothetical protein